MSVCPARAWMPCCSSSLSPAQDLIRPSMSANGRILLANSNQWYFNKLVKISCHKTPCRCPHCLNLSSQSSRSCAGPNTKVLKDKDLEFANSIHPLGGHHGMLAYSPASGVEKPVPANYVELSNRPGVLRLGKRRCGVE